MGGAITSSGDCVRAQITPDGTLGAESSVVTPTNVNGLPTNQIDGGATRGSNLFHSFEQFSIPTGGAAHFNNAANIQNIFSRVTGSSISNIDGLIRANGTANLFLLNPNGIIFGPNASLNIGGSFLGSTASSINFADGTQFSAIAPQIAPLLTVSVPIGLQYGGTAGGIQVQESRLRVRAGQTLALMGGDVSVEGGDLGFLSALGGRIELGGLGGAGTLEIEGQQSDGAFGLTKLRFPNQVERADVLLTNLARINVAASGGGSIVINARNIDISGSSVLSGGLATNSGFLGATAGDITLNATGAINFANSSTIANNVESEAVGNGGNIDITTGSLSLTNGAQLQALTRGQGDAGSVTIDARDTVSFDGEDSDGYNSDAISTVGSGAVGQGGSVNITTGSLSLTNGTQLIAATFGQGDAGSVNILARDTVSFDGVGSDGFSSGAFSSVGASNSESRAVGNGGNINIQTGSLSVTSGAGLIANTFGQGDAGSVNINARDTVSFNGVSSNGLSSAAFSDVNERAVGNGGDINIQTGSLFVISGAQLVASTRGKGSAGNVNITANTISFDGVSSDGIYPSAAFSSVGSRAVGNGGSVNISAKLLSVTNGARLSASSEGSGAAGSIEVAADSIRLDNQALLSSKTTGEQGNIFLHSGDLVLRRNSNITTNATGTATGGNITIDADVIAALENSDISANASQGPGGRVVINAQGIFGTQFRNQQTPLSDITASSNLGPQFSGTVEINTPDVDPSQGLATLPAELVEASGLIATGCAADEENKFIVTGRGGLPPNPGDTLTGEAVLTSWATLDPEAENRSSAAPSTNPTKESVPTQIVEAQGWVINDKGELVLTAHAPNVTPHIPWLAPANCHTP